MSFAGSLFQSALRLSNPYLVPAANMRMAKWAFEHPTETVHRVEASIERAIRYFKALPQLDLAALILLGRLNRLGAEPRLSFIEHRISEYAGRSSDPHLRMLDPSYVLPDERIGEAREAYDHPILQLMIRCLYADRNSDGDICLERLAEIGDEGGYGTTHVVVGGLLLREFGAAADQQIDIVMQSAVEPIIAAQRTDRSSDLFAERIVVLQWLDRQSSIEPAWILRLVNAQGGDGGWTAGPSLRRAKSNQHTSALALVALVQWSAKLQ